jgi:hypothetical protein
MQALYPTVFPHFSQSPAFRQVAGAVNLGGKDVECADLDVWFAIRLPGIRMATGEKGDG